MADWKDILYEEDKPLSEEDLLKYFDENKSSKDNHPDDSTLDDFEKDALQGLQKVESTDKIKQQVIQLKNNLHSELNKRKKKKTKRKISGLDLVMFAAILLLLVCIIGYGLIRLYNK